MYACTYGENTTVMPGLVCPGPTPKTTNTLTALSWDHAKPPKASPQGTPQLRKSIPKPRHDMYMHMFPILMFPRPWKHMYMHEPVTVTPYKEKLAQAYSGVWETWETYNFTCITKSKRKQGRSNTEANTNRRNDFARKSTCYQYQMCCLRNVLFHNLQKGGGATWQRSPHNGSKLNTGRMEAKGKHIF